MSLIYPDLNTVGWGLDNANRLTTIGWNATSGLFSQSYDSSGRMVGQGKLGGATTYGYDSIGRLTLKTNDVQGTNYDVTWTFAYNPAGQILSSDASTTVFDYDRPDNIINNSTFDGLNRDTGIVSVGGYDARGNLTYEGTGGRTMTYDVENRLLTATGTSINVKLDYDPEGRLYRYSNDGGTNWTTFLYDGVNLIGEYADAATTPLRRYVHGSGTDNPLVWFEGAGNTDARWYYTNHQGSVVGIADGNGATTAVYRYDPYGVPMDINNNPAWSGSRFRYTGQTMLPEARLYYYKARVYDPGYGRFLQTDPIGSKDDLNLYQYVDGDPINQVDPTGLCGGGRSQRGEGKPCDYTKNASSGRAHQPAQQASSGPPVAEGWTVKIGVEATAAAAVVNGSTEQGIAFDSKGNVVAYNTVTLSAPGEAIGTAAAGGVVIGGSNGSTDDMKGLSGQVAGQANGLGGAVSGTVSDGKLVGGVQVLIGVGGGASGSVGVSHTETTPIGRSKGEALPASYNTCQGRSGNRDACAGVR